MKLLSKKAQVGGMQAFIMGIVTVAIVLAIGLIVLQELRTAAIPEGANASNASVAVDSIIGKLSTVPTWIGIYCKVKSFNIHESL